MRLLAVPLAVALPVLAAAAPVPLVLSHSGYLLTDADAPVTRTGVQLGFSLWSVANETGASYRVWPSAAAESLCTTDAKAGYYAVLLDGSGSGCGAGLSSDAIPPGAERFLQVSVEGTPLLPRMRVGTMPTAAVAAQSLDAQALASALKTPGGVVNDAGNPVDWDALKNVPEAIAAGTGTTYGAEPGGGLALTGTAFSIAAGGVTTGHLDTTGATNGQALVKDSTGAAWAKVKWGDLDDVPEAFADGTDDGASYTAASGGGLSLASNAFSVAAGGVTNDMLASDAASLAKVSAGEISASASKVVIGPPTGGFAQGSGLIVTRAGTSTVRLENTAAAKNFELQVQADGVHLAGMNSGQPFLFEPGAVERMRLDPAGNLGIGTTNPLGQLDVGGNLVVKATGEVLMPNRPFFYVTNSGFAYYKGASVRHSAPTGGFVATINTGGAGSISPHVSFTAPVAGVYLVGYFHMLRSVPSGSWEAFLSVNKNGSFLRYWGGITNAAQGYVNYGAVLPVQLAAGDVIEPWIHGGTSGNCPVNEAGGGCPQIHAMDFWVQLAQ